MTQSVLDHVEPLVLQFIEWLYQCRTIGYAFNHSQMEAWVALEALEFFASEGWACCETVGFITDAPVHSKRKRGADAAVKFPDLVCVLDDVCLRWELKAISRLALHPNNAIGMVERDVRALLGFRAQDTRDYVKNGSHPRYRPRNDARSLDASGLRKSLCKAKQHVGIVLLFLPGEDEVLHPYQEPRQPWRPEGLAEDLAKRLDQLEARHAAENSAKRIQRGVVHDAREPLEHRHGTPTRHPLPRCRGWLVSMG